MTALRPFFLALVLTLAACASASAQSKTYTPGENNTDPVSTTGDITLTVNDANAATQSGVISGPDALTKSGTGTLTLTGTNTYEGGTTVSAGTLTISSNTNLGAASGALAVTSGATFNAGTYFDSNRAITLDGTGTSLTTNNGELIIARGGIGSLALTNNATASTYGLNLAFEGGTGTVDISSGANLNVSAITYINTASSSLNINTGGTFTTAGLVNYGGSFNLAGGTLRTNASFTSASDITLSNSSTVNSNGFSPTLSGVLSGTGSLTKSGAGTLILTADNTYTGGTTVSAGTLQLGNGTATGSVAGNITNDASVAFNRSNSSTYAGVISGSGAVTQAGSGTLTFTGANSSTGTTTINSGSTLQLGDGVTNGSVASASIVNDGTLIFDRTDDYEFNSVVSGSGGLILDGSVLRLVNPQTYTGPTAVKNGAILVLSTGSAQGLSASTTVDLEAGTILDISNQPQTIAGLTGAGEVYSFGGSGGVLTVDVASGQDQTFSGELGSDHPAFSIAKAGDGALTLSGANTYTGTTSVDAGTLVLGNTTTSPSFAIASGATLELNVASGTRDNPAATTFTGSGTLAKTGEGNAQWGASAATFALGSGALIDVQAGTLTGGSSTNEVWTNNLADLNVASGATFTGVESNVRVDALTGAGTITTGFNGAGYTALTIGVDDGSGTFSGVIADTDGTHIGNLVKVGSGTQTLTGANTYTGTTTISGGTLELGNGGSIASASIVNNGNLTFNRSDSATYAGSISGTGDLDIKGAGSLTLANANTFSGTTNIDTGTLLILEHNQALQNSTLVLDGTGHVITNGLGSPGSRGTLTLGGLSGNEDILENGPEDESGTAAEISSHLVIGANGDHTTYSGTIDGATRTLTKTGTGTLTLSGANTYGGGTAINGGTLQIDSDERLGDFYGALSLAGGTLATTTTMEVDSTRTITLGSGDGTFTPAASTTLTLGNSITGSGALIKNGAGTLTMSGSNNYSGGTSILAGTLEIDSDVLGAGSGALTIDGGTLHSTTSVELSRAVVIGASGGTVSGDVTVSGALSGSGTLTKTSGATLTLAEASPGFTGAVAVNAGELAFQTNNVLNSAASVDLASGSTLNLDSYSATIADLDGAGGINLGSAGGSLTTGDANDHTLSGTLSGDDATLTKTGSGNLTLSGNNSYSGTTAVSAGTLTVGSNSALGSSSATVSSGATLDLDDHSITVTGLKGAGSVDLGSGTLTVANSFDDNTFSGTLAGTDGALTKSDSGTLILTGANSYTGATTISGGTLQIGDGGSTGSIASATVTNNATLTFNRSNGIAFAGNIEGSGTLNQVGSGTVTLSGNNTYTGATTVSSGTLALASASALGTTAAGTTVESTATLAFTNNISVGAEAITNDGTVDNLSGNNSYAGALSGSGNLTVTAGQLTLSGNNSFNGGTAINGGTLVLGSANALGSTTSVDVANGASLDLNDHSVTIADLDTTGTGAIDLGSATLTTGDADDHALTGIISGSGSLTKQGSGNLTLSGANTYEGGTTVTTGTLTGTTSSLQGDIANDAAVVFDQSTTGTYAGVLSGTGSLTKSGSGNVTLSGNNTYSGSTAVDVGTFTLASSSALGTTDGDTTIASGATLALTNNISVAEAIANAGTVSNVSGANTLSGILSGAGAVSVTSGNLSLTGSNTYTGATAVDGGTLTLTSDTALGTTASGTTVASGASLAFTNNISVGAEAIANSGTVTNTSGSNSYAGVLSGAGHLTVEAGNLTLSGDNTYQGATTLSAGTLTLGHDNALGATASVDVASGATLDLNDHSVTIADLDGAGNIALGSATLTTGDADNHALSGVISGTGALTKQGVGNLTLSGANTYEGATTVSGGTLTLASDTALGTTAAGTTVASGATLAFTSDITVGAETIANAGTVNNVSGTNSYAGALSGAGNLTVTAGQLTLSADNSSFTGATTLSGGTLGISADNQLGSTSSALTLNGGTLATTTTFELDSGRSVTLGANGGTINTATSTTLSTSGNVSGSGALTKSGDGTLVLNNSNSYAGGTSVDAGTLDLQSIYALAASAPVTVASGASLVFNSNDQTFGSLAGAGNLVLGSATLTTGDANHSTFSGVISGSGASLFKDGSGTLTLTGENTYTGPTTINAGTIAIAADSGLGVAPESSYSDQLTLNGGTLLATTDVTLDANRGIFLNSSGGTLESTYATTLTVNGEITGSGNLGIDGEGNVTLARDNSFSGTTTLLDADGTLTLGHVDALKSSELTTTGGLRFGSLESANLAAISGTQDLVLQNGSNAAVALTLGYNNSTTATHSGVISGSGSIELVGGQLTLTGANTFTGPTTLSSSGTLILANESGLQNSTVTLSGGTLSYDSGVDAVTFGGLAGSNDLTLPSVSLTVGGNNAPSTYSGSISGSGAFIKAGSGNLIFSGSFNDEAPVSLDGGTFTLADSSALERNVVTLNGGTLSFGTLTSATLNGLNGSTNLALTNVDTMPAAVALTVGDSSGDSTYSGVLSGADGSLAKVGSGTFTLSGANTFTGDTTVSGGTLAITSSGSLAGDVNLDSGGTLSLANATGLQHSTVSLNGGDLSYDSGLNAVTFGGLAGSNNLYLPSTSLTVGGNNQNTSYSGTVYNSGTFIKAGDGNLTFGGTFEDSAPVRLDAGTFTLGNSSALANSEVTLNGGTLSFGTQTSATLGGLAGSQDLALTNSVLNAVALTIGNSSENGPSNSTYSGVLSGTNGSLTKDGSGTLTLSGANTFSGTTTVYSGTLALSSSGSLAGNVNLNSGTLSLGNETGLQSSTVTMNGGTLSYGSGVNAVTFGGLDGSNDLTLPSTSLTVGGNNQNTSYTGTIYNSSTFIKAGTGNLTFGGSFNESAPVRLDAGTFTLGNSSALQYADVTLNGGTLSFGAQTSATLGSLAGSGDLALTNATLGAVALTVGNNGGSSTYSGVLSGTEGSLTKEGGGTFILSGANTFTGATTLSEGTLTLGHENALANSVITASGGGLSFGALENVNLRAFNTSSEVVVSSTSANPFTLTIGGSGNDNSTWSNYLRGSGSINKVGSGTLTLSGGSGGYSGTTTLTGGTVKLEDSSVLENSTVRTVSGGGTLDFASNTTVELGGLEGDGNLTLANQAFSAVTLGVGKNDANTTFSGALSGTGSLDKKGAGTLTLSGANTFSGTTTISAGTLELAHALALQDSVVTPGSGLSFGELESATFAGLDGSGSVVLTNTATPTAGVALTLDLAADMPTGQTYYGTVSGDGSLIKTGTGTQTLSGSLSHAGGTTVAAGTLTLSGTNTASGDTTVSGGTLQLVSTNALQNSTLVTAAAGGAVTFSDQTAFTLGGLEGDGNLSLSNGPSAITLTVGNNNASTAYSGVLSQGVSGFDSANLIKVGSGTLTLGGANTFSGTTTISAGTLELGHTNALQSSIVAPGSGLSFGTLESATVGGLSGSGALALTNTGETPDGVALTLNVASGFPPGPTFSGVLSGDGSLTKSGAGTQILSGANTFTGETTVSAGTLKLENSNALQNSTLVTSASGGSVDFSSLSTLNLGGLAGNGNISASFFSLALNVGANGDDTTYSGVLSDNGMFSPLDLTKSGNGTLTLSGANTFAGTTTVSAGTLEYATRSAFYNGTTRANPAVADGATAAFHVGDSGYFTDSDIGDILGDGNFSSGATLELNTADALAGTFTLATALANGNSGADTLNLAKSGTGNLVLSGSNTYTGTTTLKSGTLTLASDTALGTTTGGTTVASGATLAFTNNIAVGTEAIANSGTVTNTSGTNSYAGILSGTGNLSIAAGALTLSGENTFTGSTSVNGGTLSIAADSALGAAPGTATAGHLTLDGGTLATTTSVDLAANRGIALGASGGTVETADAMTLTYGGIIDGSGALTKSGTGTLSLSGANTFTGDTTVSGGTLTLAHTDALAGSTLTTAAGVSFGTLTSANLGGLSGSDNVTLANASSSDLALNVGANGANTTYSGVLSGSGTLTKSGSGTLTLTNSSDLSSATTVNAGTLAIASGGTFTATGGLVIGDGAESVAAFGLHSGGTLEVSGANGITKQSSNAFLDANDGTLRVVGGTLNTNVPVTVADNASFMVDTNGFLTVLGGQISGNGGVVKTGAGQLTLAEINTYTGPTTISGGTLSANADSRLGAAPTEATGGHLTLDGGTLLSVGSGYTLDSNRGIALGASGGTIEGSIAYGGIIAGSGSLTKIGNNSTLSLTGTNTYTGATSVTGGTLSINADAALGAVPGSTTPGHLTLNGGTLATTTTFELAEQRGVALGASGGTVNTAAGTTLSYDGIIAGAGGLTKSGDGTLTLGGTNTYSGATNLNAGTLSIAADAALGTAPASASYAHLGFNGGTLETTATMTLAANRNMYLDSNGGSLDVADATTLTYGGIIGGSGGLTKSGDGTLTLTGAQTYTGAITVNGGTLNLDSGHYTTMATSSIANEGTLNLAHTFDLTLAANLSGSGTITNASNSTLRLTGNNTNTGAIQVTQGTVEFGARQAFYNNQTLATAAAGLHVADGTTASFHVGDSAYFTSSDIAAITANASFDDGATLGLNTTNATNGAFTLSAALTDTNAGANVLSLEKLGAGNLTLAGANTYTGTTTVSEGTLTFGTLNAFYSGDVSTTNAAKLDVANGATAAFKVGVSGGFDTTDLATVAANATFASGATLGLDTSDAVGGSFDFTHTGTYDVAKTGSGTLVLTGENTGTGSLIAASGVLQIGDGGTTSLAASTVTADASLVFNHSNDFSYAGTIDGSGTFAKTGTGTLILTGDFLPAGATTISQGTLAFNDPLTFSGPVTVTGSGATLAASSEVDDFTSFASYTVFGTTAGSTSLTVSNGGTVTGGQLAFDSMDSDTTALLVESGGTIGVDGFFTVGANTDYLTTAAITGSNSAVDVGGISLIGAGGLGEVTVADGGTFSTSGLMLGVGGVGTLNIENGGTVNTGGIYAGLDFIGPVPGTAGIINLRSGGTLQITTTDFSFGAVSIATDHPATSALNLAGGTLVVSDNNFSTDIATTLADATTSTIQVSTGLDATFSTALSGNGSLAKTGTGTLTLSGTNTYEGGTTVSAGTLAATDATQFGTGAITVQSGGNVTLATPTAFNQSVTIDGTGASVVGDAIGGTLGMTSSFTQFGSSGTATTLTVSNGGSLAGANLDFGANADQNFTASVASGGTITAGATVVIGRNATAASDVTVTGADSALTVGDFANSTFDDEIMVGYGNSAQATLTIADGGRVSSTYTYIGENGGDGFLHIADGGTLTTRRVVLTQASDANNGGTLQVDSGGTLQVSKVDGYAYYGQIGNEGDQGLLRLNGGTLQVHDTSAIFVNAQTELTSGTTSVIDTAGVNNLVSFTTNVSGAGNLQVAGGGIVAVVGANTFSGRVQIEDGTFALDTTASIDASAGVDLGTAGILDLTIKSGGFSFGTDQTLSGSGTVLLAANQTLDFAGTLAPGNSPGIITVDGNLVLNSSAVIAMELAPYGDRGGDSVDYDIIDVLGDLTLGGTLTLSGYGGYIPQVGDSFQLFYADSIGGSFAAINFTGFNGVVTFDAASLTSGLISIASVSAVPEPATAAALLGLVILGFATTRRRRRA